MEPRTEVDGLITQLVNSGLSLHEIKLRYVYQTIKSCGGDKSRAVRTLGMNRFYLTTFIKRYGWMEFYGRCEG